MGGQPGRQVGMQKILLSFNLLEGLYLRHFWAWLYLTNTAKVPGWCYSNFFCQISMIPNMQYDIIYSTSVYVTGSAKAGLIAEDRKFDFFTQTQSLMNAPSNFTVIVDQSKVVCFFKAQW